MKLKPFPIPVYLLYEWIVSFNPPVSLTIGIAPYLNAISCPSPQGSNNDGIKKISEDAYILWANPLSNFIFAGKAAPAYYLAKNTIELINAVAKKVNNDKRINDKIKVVFLENYRVSLAEKIIPATDLSEQISTTTKEASGTSNMKFMMNGAVTIATLDGANIEIRDEVGDDNIVIFGLTENEVLDYYSRGGYSAWDVRNNDNRLIRVTDDLINGVYSKDRDKFRSVYDNLLTYNDEFFVLKDFDSYLKAQDKVDLLYRNNKEWQRKCGVNIAHSGIFSSDRTIAEYATGIWGSKVIYKNL